MKRIKVYMEGGGTKSNARAQIRQGMLAFVAKCLGRSAGDIRRRIDIVPSGSRGEARKAFDQARKLGTEEDAFLLVDSEAEVTTDPLSYLAANDNWTFTGVSVDRVHLMIQVMEAWIVADTDALRRLYKAKLNEAKLRAVRDLEAVPKQDVLDRLKDATSGSYHKIEHASKLLADLDPATVYKHCPSAKRFADALAKAVAAA